MRKRLGFIVLSVGLLIGVLFAVRAYTQTPLPPSLPNSATIFQPILPTLQATHFPVRLPTYIPTNRLPHSGNPPPVQAVLNRASDQGYVITLGYSPDCEGGNACRFGTIAGNLKPQASIEDQYAETGRGTDTRRSPEPIAPVQLANNIQGWFIPWTCGANCSDGLVVWDEYVYRYLVGVKVGNKEALIQMANSAIGSGKP